MIRTTTLLLTVSLLVSAAQAGTPSLDRPGDARLLRDERLLALVDGPFPVLARLDSSDFATKLHEALAFMRPGSRLESLSVEQVATWTPELETALRDYLQEAYASFEGLDAAWSAEKIDQWRAAGALPARVTWTSTARDLEGPHRSVAVLASDGRVLFDTILARMLTSVETPETVNADRRAKAAGAGGLAGAGPVVSGDDSMNVVRTFNGPLGSVDMRWEVSARVTVPSYVTEAADATYELRTTRMRLRRENSGGIPPLGEPLVYFGTDGRFAEAFGSSKPYESRVSISGGEFAPGEYSMNYDESGWRVNFAVGVSTKGAGLAFDADQLDSMGLADSGSSTRIVLTDRVYTELLPGLRYRGVFGNGGSLSLTNFFFRSNSAISGETGTARADLPVRLAHHSLGVLTLMGEGPADTLRPSVRFIKAGSINEPVVTLQSLRQRIDVGEETILNVRVRNESFVVNIEGGTVSLDTATLDGQGLVTPKSVTSFPIGTIAPREAKDFQFVVEGARDGAVSPQVVVTDAGYGTPATEKEPFEAVVGLQTVSLLVGEGDPTGFGGFRRGDPNADGSVDITDAVSTLLYLFSNGTLSCIDAGDVDDSGSLNITDPISLLAFLFSGGNPPASPYPGCGRDPTADDLECASYPECGGTPITGPVVHLAMDEYIRGEDEFGDDVRYTPDASGNGNHGYVPTGGPSPKPTATEDRFADETGALEFFTNPGQLNSFLNLGHIGFDDSLTLALWTRFNEGGGRKHLVGQRDWMRLMVPQSRGSVNFEIIDPDGEQHVIVGPGTIEPRVWYLLVATLEYDGQDSIVKIYRDEELLIEERIAGIRFGTFERKEISVGALLRCNANDEAYTVDDCDNSNDGYKGMLDDLRIYDRAISASEVSELYREGGF